MDDDEISQFDKAYNSLFKWREVNTQHMAECEMIWDAAISLNTEIQRFGVANHEAQKRIAELLVENFCKDEALRKDAERYRWLREHLIWCSTFDCVDDAIDAAMLESQTAEAQPLQYNASLSGKK